jgi:hypothetical protein
MSDTDLRDHEDDDALLLDAADDNMADNNALC